MITFRKKKKVMKMCY